MVRPLTNIRSISINRLHELRSQPRKIVDVLTKSQYASTFAQWVIALMLLIVVGSIFLVINQETPLASLQAGEDGDMVAAEGEMSFWPTLFHPKVLGMVVVLLISYFTIGYLSKKAKS